MLHAAKQDLEFLRSLEITDLSSRKIFSNYYDVLRAITEAIAALDGYKVYSHEAFTYYLKENKKEENAALKFDRLRKLRNNVNYYGKTISKEESKEHKEEILKLVKALEHKYLLILKE